VCLAAALGLDLFEDRERREQRVERLEDEKRKLDAEVISLRKEIALIRSGPQTGTEMPVAETLLARLERREWHEFAAGVDTLLAAGEPGFETLVETARRGLDGAFEAFRQSGALLPLLRVVAANEREVDEFLAHALLSKQFREDPAFRDWLLEWGAWFVAGSRESSGVARSLLYQSLQSQLRTTHAGAPEAVQSLELLTGHVPVEAIAEILADRARRVDHGPLLIRLQERGDAAAVKAIVDYAHAVESEENWLPVPLERLASIPGEEAGAALRSFMESPSETSRQAAHVAYFSRPRSADEGLDVLVAFLNSGSPEAAKRRVLARAGRSPELLAALRQSSERLGDARVRALVEGTGAPAPASFDRSDGSD
jgi:hypothetical protein